jgi:subtilisin-like proprotein convertase family protein
MLSLVRRAASRSRYGLTLLSLSMVAAGVPRPALAADRPLQFLEVTDPGQEMKEGSQSSAPANQRGLTHAPTEAQGQGLTPEVEPNDTSGTATPLVGTNLVVRANVFPAADVDFYSFQATAGDRIYAAVQTLFDGSASGDSVLDLLGTDGTTVIETDLNDGSLNINSSSIAGAVIPSTGTFFLRVRHNVATGTIRPYDLHLNKLAGTPVPEVEPNNTDATANPVPASGWISGDISAISPGEADFFSVNLAAGDSVYLSLDMNPERDANVWNGRLGFGLFGNPPANQILLVNDANAGATDPNSEAFFFTVLTAGTYFIYVDSIVAAGLGANATYHLSVAVHPAAAAANCTTYTSTDVPKVIAADPPSSVTSTLTIPGNPRIEDLDVSINLNHTFMADLDVHLISPAGNDNGLFTDIGAVVNGPQTLMDLRFDDEAALPPAFALSASMVVQPELNYRLSWYDGENAGGTWTLQIRDDATVDGGTLNAWSMTVCEPPPPPACAPGFLPETVFTTDFESGAAGFTHSGVGDEWELGLPATVATTTAPPVAAFTTCNSGTSCWKTDLDNTYNASSNQDLLSPNINLSGLVGPVVVTWSQRYQMESATFDHMSVDYQQVGGATPVRLFEFRDATMTNTAGNTPVVNIGESSGWSTLSRRVDSLAGLNTELRFHLDGDTTVQLGGLAIDDVTVTACRADPNALHFFAVTPCRVVDTRTGLGGPVVQGQSTRVFTVEGLCSIPASAKSISLNVIANQATAPGDLRLFEAGQPVPNASTLNYVPGKTRANNAIVKLNAAGEIAAFAGQAAGTTVHVIIDVNGYFE